MADVQAIIALRLLSVISVSLKRDSWQNTMHLIRPEAPNNKAIKGAQNRQKEAKERSSRLT